MARRDLIRMAIDAASAAVDAAQAKGGASPEFLMQHANTLAQLATAKELQRAGDALEAINQALRTKAQEGIGSTVANLVDHAAIVAREIRG